MLSVVGYCSTKWIGLTREEDSSISHLVKYTDTVLYSSSNSGYDSQIVYVTIVFKIFELPKELLQWTEILLPL